ncbi:MAG: biotin/lipoyl-binding protein, partial [Melioribacteraceae bacterium]|nr:biotin/lipoyl-binding protein [Melioribacteraceae bacterium]
MNRFFKLIYKLLIGSILILVVLNCSDEESKVDSEKTIPVTLVEIEESPISIPIIASGKVQAQKEIKLAFKTGGVIENLYANEGDQIKKGELLANINLQEINAQVIQAESAFKKAERDYARIEALYKDSVVTLEGYQNTKTALDVAEANLNIARFNQDYSTIVAPTNGRIYK